jgi:PAS domain S-box-containing protein
MVIGKTQVMPTDAAELRKNTEEQITAKQSGHLPLTKLESQRLVHELEVHQVELEMQNDELRRFREESELSRNMYAELYDFAPIAYFTFDSHGVIQEVNHTCAHLLGIERGLLANRPFTNFIANSGEQEVFLNHLSLVLQRNVLLKCSLTLTNIHGALIHAQLQSVAVTSNNRAGYILTSIVDGTVRKQFEVDLKKAYDQLEELVKERTRELTQEIEERKKAEESLKSKNAEILMLKDRLQAENVYLQQEVAQHFNFGEIIGQSNAISRIFSQIEQVAPMNATVLVLGETGTGKGMVARAIHSRGTRKSRPLITVNCTTLPATLVESELFGRERGAFTGSDSKQIGRFELANGGTIFLDEIGEMPLELQSKLLRVIQDGEFERLGNPRTIKTDVRIIAASNRNLSEEVRNGKFREDLFYRLNVFPITLPPLRQRSEDIPLLVKHFVNKFNIKNGKKIENVSNETMKALQGYNWPGNVRELESIIERAAIISQGNTLQILERFDMIKKPEEPAGQDIKALVDLEHDHILKVLKKTGWRIEGKNGAAILLGLNASTLRARMRKYGIFRL